MSKRNSTPLTIERLREVLDYCPETGLFTWKISASNRKPAGSIAGTIDSYGHVYISIANKNYPAHRLALFWVNGKPSTCEHVDHRDRNPSNNRFSNLRELTCSQNLQNSKVSKANTSGIKGVSWDRFTGKWAADLAVGGKLIRLGRFALIEDAIAARKAAEITHHPFRVTTQ